MGTRGAWGFVLNGQEKLAYNQYDSYPAGLGTTVLSWLREALSDESALRQQVKALAKVPDREPTDEERARYAQFHQQVSTGRDWYALLRYTQGQPALTLDVGLYEDASEFPLDSLFCEWAYVIDLDARRFELYEGFQIKPVTTGRWTGKRGEHPKYYPVRLLESWGFDELPAELTDRF